MIKKNKQHLDNFEKNISDVKRLLEIHKILTGPGRGYRKNVEVLNKSCTVLLVACWEAFLEELATKAFDYMINNSKDCFIFPNKVLTTASEELKKDSDSTKIWLLAGMGWKKVLEQHKDKTLKKFIERFNTPSPEKIKYLFHNLIGLSDVTQFWYWKGMSIKQANAKLDKLVKLRGEIAHKVQTPNAVDKACVYDYMKFIYRISVKCHNNISNYISNRTHSNNDWPKVRFGRVG